MGFHGSKRGAFGALLLAVVLLSASGAARATTQTKACGAGADDIIDGGNVAWSLPNRITIDDTLCASVDMSPAQTSHYITCTGLGFTIPAGATINGITAACKGAGVSAGAIIQDNSVKAVRYGVLGGTDQANGTLWPNIECSSSTTKSWGGASNLWGLSWDAAAINDASSGFAIQVLNSSGVASRQARLQYCTMTVNYTAGAPSSTPTSTPTATPTQTPVNTTAASNTPTPTNTLGPTPFSTWGVPAGIQQVNWGVAVGTSALINDVPPGDLACIVSLVLEPTSTTEVTITDGNGVTIFGTKLSTLTLDPREVGPCLVTPVKVVGSGRATVGWRGKGHGPTGVNPQ